MEIASFLTLAFSSQPLYIAAIITFLCFLFVVFAFRSGSIPFVVKKQSSLSSTGFSHSSAGDKDCNCPCSCNGSVVLGGSDFAASASSMSLTSRHLNGGVVEMLEAPKMVTDRQTGASMMEQLVPEITTHALSYLDYPSLCRLSMTNSLMHKAANDDNAWKALYHKDFTLEQDNVTPVNGWKAYYAATRAIVNINAEFFDIVRQRSISEMSRFWRTADYVKCIHASGEFFSGYNAVMRSWQLAFDWEQGFNFQIRDVRARVFPDMAWVTMKTYVDMDTGPFNVTNVFECHNDRWYMVHHHCSVMLIDGEMEQQIVHGNAERRPTRSVKLKLESWNNEENNEDPKLGFSCLSFSSSYTNTE